MAVLASPASGGSLVSLAHGLPSPHTIHSPGASARLFWAILVALKGASGGTSLARSEHCPPSICPASIDCTN